MLTVSQDVNEVISYLKLLRDSPRRYNCIHVGVHFSYND